MKLMTHTIGAGAKGKFSGGFDINAFGSIQGGQHGKFFALYSLILMQSFMLN